MYICRISLFYIRKILFQCINTSFHWIFREHVTGCRSCLWHNNTNDAASQHRTAGVHTGRPAPAQQIRTLQSNSTSPTKLKACPPKQQSTFTSRPPAWTHSSQKYFNNPWGSVWMCHWAPELQSEPPIIQHTQLHCCQSALLPLTVQVSCNHWTHL